MEVGLMEHSNLTFRILITCCNLTPWHLHGYLAEMHSKFLFVLFFPRCSLLSLPFFVLTALVVGWALLASLPGFVDWRNLEASALYRLNCMSCLKKKSQQYKVFIWVSLHDNKFDIRSKSILATTETFRSRSPVHLRWEHYSVRIQTVVGLRSRLVPIVWS